MIEVKMDPDLAARAIAANARLGEAFAELISIADAIRASLSTAVETPVKPALNAPQTREEALAAHRRAHRPGHPSKIDSDPELQAFILARIETQTFDQITAAIKATFPATQHVGRTAVHRWWRLYEARGRTR